MSPDCTLRHFNVHLAASRLTTGVKRAEWTFEGKTEEFDYEVWTIVDFTLPAARALRDARFYSEAELQRLVDWFNIQQQEWGVPHLLSLAVQTYAECLLKDYGVL